MSYDMDHGKVCVICSLTEPFYDAFLPYFPYVPFFSDWLIKTRSTTQKVKINNCDSKMLWVSSHELDFGCDQIK